MNTTKLFTFRKNIAGNGYVVTGCNKEVQNLIIPSVYRNQPVTAIDNYAFFNHTNLTRVIIPDNVTIIWFGAFSGCTNLKNVIILSDEIEIDDHAFVGCTSLTGVVFSKGVIAIGDCAFGGCNSLISKPNIYKAFKVKKDKSFVCRNMTYYLNEWNECSGELELCKNGLHYCTNLFEIFNYYSGRLDKDIAICECEVDGEILTSDTSKCCARRLKPVKRLTREEIIALLN